MIINTGCRTDIPGRKAYRMFWKNGKRTKKLYV